MERYEHIITPEQIKEAIVFLQGKPVEGNQIFPLEIEPNMQLIFNNFLKWLVLIMREFRGKC